MPANFAQALVFIINALTSLYLLVLLLRFWLPWLQADFRNPLAQGILKLTSPLVIPLRRIVPSFGRLDTATVLIAFAIQYLAVLVMLLIIGLGPAVGIVPIAITAAIKLIVLSINLFIYAIVIRIILSWVAPGLHNPATAIISTLSNPVLRPFQRMIPPLGGFDISPLFATILLIALTIVINGYRPLPI